MLCLLVFAQCVLMTDMKRNLAKGQPTWQYSESWGGAKERANDGNRSPLYTSGASCSHTAYGLSVSPYWTVDLGWNVNIAEIKITNRSGGDRELICQTFLGDSVTLNVQTLRLKKNPMLLNFRCSSSRNFRLAK